MGFLVPPLNLKYVKIYRDRHGKTRYYFRKKGAKSVKLPDFHADGFLEAYHAALTGYERIEPKADTIKSQTLDHLIVLWMKSPHFLHLESSTKAVYTRLLNRVRGSEASQGNALSMQAKHIRVLVSHFGTAPTTAQRILRLLGQLMQFSISLGWREDDPTLGIKIKRQKSEGIHSWTEGEIAQFEAHWPSGSIQRLALYLMLYTGQRRSDVVRIGPADISSNSLSLKQKKTKTELVLPIHEALRSEINQWRGSSQTYLEAKRGSPYTANGFYNVFKAWCREAGLPEQCSPHGLRKAAARRLAEAGCSANQIAAITGHKRLADVAHYTKAAEQRKMAEDAMSRLGKNV
ncbi:tyrosine-type recombinase/integrase [Acetobacter lambici]|uniref:Tyrosine-type recombinase/integrase n=1 Tax=Acetobacter lambici TaxID=1332824 RepID=A0ABT1EZZ0_9PROT|nr:tyrosine-type recombinase/integrase [Acetobacter lambici]MCP1243226.1 tyrosine-type recombinase/integrase [Acetobacter lambici]MCP1258512.1 tyrosine-type recombinase/integrase [Acetobacter lambici]